MYFFLGVVNAYDIHCLLLVILLCVDGSYSKTTLFNQPNQDISSDGIKDVVNALGVTQSDVWPK